MKRFESSPAPPDPRMETPPKVQCKENKTGFEDVGQHDSQRIAITFKINLYLYLITFWQRRATCHCCVQVCVEQSLTISKTDIQKCIALLIQNSKNPFKIMSESAQSIP